MNEKNNKLVNTGIKALLLLFAIMTFCMVWVSFNAQSIANEAVLEALETVSEMEAVTETTTQTVEGDSAIINNAEFDQYNSGAEKGGS